jgi:hypothetical protein
MNMPELHFVESRAIEMIGYDETDAVLCVMYKGGATYGYQGVTLFEYEQLLAAESMGNYINTVIKPAYAGFQF